MDEPDGGTFGSSRGGLVGAVVGLVLAGIVAVPWVGRGQVLLLDWVSGPYLGPLGPILGADGSTLGASPFLLLLRAQRMLLGPSVASWLPLVAWMPLVGWGVGRLTRRAGWAAAAAAAALACCNPFTMDRMAIGQLNVLWGYALLPLAMLTLASEPGRLVGWAARAGLVGAALTAVSPHFFAYWLVVVVVSVALLPGFRRRATGTLLAVSAAVLASCYLVVVRAPSLTIDQADLSAFRTRSEPPGLALTIMTLRGFWRPFDVTPPRSSGAWALVALLGACATFGLVSVWRRREAVVVAVSGLVGALLAAGDQGPLGGLYRSAFEEIGAFRILREPQKASALLAIALSVLFGFGVARIISFLGSEHARVVGALVLVAVPLGTAPAFATFGARADVVRPSAAWRQADRLVGSGPAGVLALPWHLYLAYPNTRSPVANLAPTRFRAPVASGDNVELPGIETASNRQRSSYLEDRFRRGPQLTDFGAQIEPAGLRWVLLVKTVDWQAYEWLDRQQDLERVLETPELSLYRSTAATDLGPASASPQGVAGWRVRSPSSRPVPLPEVAEGRWFADDGGVETSLAGAPTVQSPETTIRSRNVQHALRSLTLSACAVAVLAVAAGRRQGRRRSARLGRRGSGGPRRGGGGRTGDRPAA